MRRGAGPGAGSPRRSCIFLQDEAASCQVHNCWTLTLKRLPTRSAQSESKSPWCTCTSRASFGCSGRKTPGSSFRPSSRSAWSIAHCAPGPHAWALRMVPVSRTCSVAGPVGVRHARNASESVRWNVGSRRPIRWKRKVDSKAYDSGRLNVELASAKGTSKSHGYSQTPRHMNRCSASS